MSYVRWLGPELLRGIAKDKGNFGLRINFTVS
jgi:hypothetical protein